MRKSAICWIVLFFSMHAGAVYQTVVIEKPFHARSVAGITVDPSGSVVGGVVISDRDRDFAHVYATTTSDANGHFSLPRDSRRVHYLKFLAPGFNPLQVTIELRSFANRDVRVKLPIGG